MAFHPPFGFENSACFNRMFVMYLLTRLFCHVNLVACEVPISDR